MFVYEHFCSLDLSISWELQSLFAQCNSHCLDCVQFGKKIDNLHPSKQHKLRLGLSVETAERERESLIPWYSSNQKGIISMNIPATMTIIRLLVTNIHIANINQEPLFSRELLMAALIHCFFTWKVKKIHISCLNLVSGSEEELLKFSTSSSQFANSKSGFRGGMETNGGKFTRNYNLWFQNQKS